MKVLLICEASAAGVGRHTIDLARGLLDGGSDVHLIYSRLRMDRAFERGLDALPTLKTRVLNMKRSPHVHDVVAVAEVAKYIRRYGPFDVVHGQSSKGGAIARLAGLLTNTPSIYTPHCVSSMAPTFGQGARLIFAKVEYALSLFTTRLIAASDEEHDHLLELGIPANKLALVHYGIPPVDTRSKAELRQHHGLPADHLIVGFVGRLSAQKNPELALECFGAVAKNRRDISLAIVGDGELEATCQDAVKRLGISDKVHFLGYQSGVETMPAFDILLVTSRYEALPYVMLEALSSALPLVITAVGGVRAVVQNGVNGFVAPLGDARALEVALAELADSTDLRRQFAREARARAEHFTLEKMVSTTLGIYRSASGGAPTTIAPRWATSTGAPRPDMQIREAPHT